MRTRWVLIAVLAAACDDDATSRDAATPDAFVARPDSRTPDGLADAAPPDLPLSDGPANPSFAKLVGLPADSWYTAPNTKMSAVCAPASFNVSGVMGCKAIVSAWGGGAHDGLAHRMFIWGGGHNDYWGNEIYALDLATMTWSRLTDPSPEPFNQDPLDDGNPVSRHTYDGLQYLGHAGRFFGQGGSRAKDGNGTRLTWIFDPSAAAWTNMQPAGADYPGAGHAYNMSSGYDPTTKRVYMRDPYNLYAYDYDTNTWTKLLDWAHAWGAQTGAVDTKRGLFFSIGSKELLVHDIAAGKDVTSQWTTSGGDALIDDAAPGLDYDSKADALVAWNGGAVWVLDMTSKVWSRKSGNGAPAAGVSNGTFGRWRYDVGLNVFILVNAVDDDVRFYKHTS